jgi:uncharacterized protein YkwD
MRAQAFVNDCNGWTHPSQQAENGKELTHDSNNKFPPLLVKLVLRPTVLAQLWNPFASQYSETLFGHSSAHYRHYRRHPIRAARLMHQTVRTSCVFSLCLIPLLPLFASPAHAGEERQLVEDINDYRAEPQRCAGRTVQALTPLALKSSLALPIGYGGVTRETLKDSGYQAVSVRTIRLEDAEDAEEAFDMLQSRYCGALLDTRFTDIGVHRDESEWQVVLAQPLLDGQVDDPRAAGKTLLAQVNAARAKPRLCGRQRFAAAPPLTWNAALGTAAQGHSRAMANDNYFAHQDPNGDMPWDRAKAAGYGGRQIGENIAAGQRSPGKAMEGWLASPGHCAILMNPMFTQVGAAYAANSRSDNGIYWTMLFGAK